MKKDEPGDEREEKESSYTLFCCVERCCLERSSWAVVGRRCKRELLMFSSFLFSVVLALCSLLFSVL